MERTKKTESGKRNRGLRSSEKDEKLKKVYYSTEGLWKGFAAVKNLAVAAGVQEEEARKFLERQALWQIFLPPPRHVPRPHWTVDQPNKVHQADLLSLPHENVGGEVFKYALVVVDVATRFKDAEPLTSKRSEVALAFKKIYSRKGASLKKPKTLVIDQGTEFKGALTKFFEGTKIRRSEPKNHRAQAFVERANRTLGEKLFRHQYTEEFVSGKTSRKWVKKLPEIMEVLNNSLTRLTGQKVIDAYMKGGKVELEPVKYDRPVGFEEERLDPLSKVRYLLQPGEGEATEVHRATDPFWSLKIFDLKRSHICANQPVLYFLSADDWKAPKRSFLREEL